MNKKEKKTGLYARLDQGVQLQESKTQDREKRLVGN